MIQENTIFALDIGTHSVVGILGTEDRDGFTVLDYEQRFHHHGAMRDGQIEDISLAAETVSEVRSALEDRNSVSLHKVSIAAAGRSLVTIQSSFEQDAPDKPLTFEHVRSVEYGALSAAAEKLTAQTQTSADGFACVGYSVTAYWLDDYRYRNLEGHQGQHIKVELIAAFLPGSVIRSLYTVTERCGLSVDSMTLEPIAAIEAVVPIDIRLLNLALVDIGAGTSDIAISKNGSIVAYDMVTLAGDEMTEAIMQRFLVDSETAEMLKQSLSQPSAPSGPDTAVSYTDILGFPQSCTWEEILSATDAAANSLCNAIADSIRNLNAETPVAVFLVGGGSQFPTLCSKLAEILGLAPERVALGGTKGYKNIRLSSAQLLSPEFVTPLGIMATSKLAGTQDFFSIHVNDQKVMLWEMGNLKVLDALLMAGIKAQQLIGRTPAPLTFTVNGLRRTIRGIPSTPGELFLNDAPASLDTSIKQGDCIRVTFAVDGTIPQITASDLLSESKVPCTCLINGREVAPSRVISLGDAVEILPAPKSDAPQQKAIDQDNDLEFLLEQEAESMMQAPEEKQAQKQEPEPMSAQEQQQEPVQEQELVLTQEQEPEPVPEQKPEAAAPEVMETASGPVKQYLVCLNGKWHNISADRETGILQFVQLLNFVDIDTKNPQGDLVLTLNGKDAAFTDPVQDGDSAEIRWSEQSR